MKKVLALIMVLGVMLFAAGAASAAGYDANISLSGYEAGKDVLGLDLEVDNAFYSIEAKPWTEMEENSPVAEAWVFSNFPPRSKDDVNFTGSFQSNTDYYVYFTMYFDKESGVTEADLLAADFRLNGQEPILVEPYLYGGCIELYFKLPALQSVPETGDGANIALWTVLMAAGFAGMVTVLRRRRA